MYSNKNLAQSLFEKLKQACLSLIANNNRYGRRVPETDILIDTRINQLVHTWDVIMMVYLLIKIMLKQ